MDRACLAAGLVAMGASFRGGKGTRTEMGVNEDLAEVRWSV